MKTGQLFFMFLFINIAFTLVNTTELADGVYLRTNAGFQNPLNSYIGEAGVLTTGLQNMLSLFEGELISLQPVRLDLLGSLFGFNANLGIDLPSVIGKPINFLKGFIDFNVNITILLGKLFLNTLIDPIFFFPSLFYAFFPTPLATLFGTLLGLSLTLVLIWDLITMLAPGNDSKGSSRKTSGGGYYYGS